MNALADHVWNESQPVDRVWAQVCGLRSSEAGERLFMVLQAYIDDSRESEDGIFVLAGYVASAEAWAAFSREWEAMLPRATLQEDGKYRFKMSEMAQSPERMSRVPGFHYIINKYALLSMAAIVPVDELKRALARVYVSNYNVDWKVSINIGFAEWNSPFYMAFRVLMDNFHKERLAEGPLKSLLGDEPVDLYFDESSEKGAVLRVWDEYVSKREPEQKRLYGATPRFEDDEKFLPIQAADFRAWWIRKWAAEFGREGLNEKGGTYPFKTAAKSLNNTIMWATEDNMVKVFMESAQQSMPAFKIEDRMQRADPPSPFERALAAIKRRLRL